MTLEELEKLIVTERGIIKALQLFLEKEKKEHLWANSLSGKYFPIKYKDAILNVTFAFLLDKVRNGKIKSAIPLSGIIVNTIREARREYLKEIYLDIKNALFVEYKDYVEGVDLFGEEEEITPFHFEIEDQYNGNNDAIEERIDALFQCLDAMGGICRNLIEYKHIQELSHEEIVEKNIGINTIESSKSKLSQCMSTLRERLKK